MFCFFYINNKNKHREHWNILHWNVFKGSQSSRSTESTRVKLGQLDCETKCSCPNLTPPHQFAIGNIFFCGLAGICSFCSWQAIFDCSGVYLFLHSVLPSPAPHFITRNTIQTHQLDFSQNPQCQYCPADKNALKRMRAKSFVFSSAPH